MMKITKNQKYIVIQKLKKQVKIQVKQVTNKILEIINNYLNNILY